MATYQFAGTYRFAGKTVLVRTQYQRVHTLCEDYQSQGVPDFDVEIAPDDIVRERAWLTFSRERDGIPAHSDSYLEELAVLRKLAEQLPWHDALLLHGSALAVDGAGYVFTAPSGTGKSTHAHLWRELLGDRVTMVNDDKPFVSVEGDEVLAHGSPWDGKHHLSSMVSVPLQSVCFLRQGTKNSIERADAQEVLPLLVRQAYRPFDAMGVKRTLCLLDKVAHSVEAWRLTCDMSLDAARLSYDAMRGAIS